MFRLFLVFLLFLAFNSCHTTYYYARLDSDNPYLEKDHKRNFVADGDGIKITYSFFGENAPLRINIFNKMLRPIFIDWESSYFYFGDNPDNRVILGNYISDYKILEIKPFRDKERLLFELTGLMFDKFDKNIFDKRRISFPKRITRSTKLPASMKKLPLF